MRSELTYATVCSGIECCSVACRGLPLRPVFFSEIEPFPCAVLKAHYPDVPNLGDMSKIQVSHEGKEITNGTITIRLHGRIDILAGGTPCQDVSVAGKRAGMQEGSGTRSSLAFDFVRLARELRPRWVLWENVAGSIDSKNAPDFLRFASALGDCGYSLAWRVLDAQYVRVDGMERAVPQRRRRVWVVGCLGADESIPAQILFEPDCIAGHTPPRRRAGQGFAYSLAGRDRVDAGMVGEPRSCSVRTANTHANGHGVATEATHTIDGANGQGVAYKSSNGKGEEVSATLSADDITQSGQGYVNNSVVQCYENHAQDSRIKPIEVSDTRNQKDGTGGNNLPLVVMAYRPPIQDLITEACAKYGATWPEDEWTEITDEVTLNIYIDMDGKRRATAFMKSDTNLEFGVDISYVGDGEKRYQEVVVSTNSNGEDVAPTLNTSMAKLGGDNQTIFGGGGGYAIIRREEGAHDDVSGDR